MSHLKTNPLKFNLPINQGFLQIYFIQKVCVISIEDTITS